MTDLHLANKQLYALRPKRKPAAEPVAAIVRRVASQPVVDTLPPSDQRQTEFVGLDSLDTSHHPKLKTAVAAARAWQQRRREQRASGLTANASLVLTSTAVEGDPNRTGYGVGKTHIAKACLWAEALFDGDEPVAPAGKLFDARRILSVLADGTPQDEIGGASIVCIDDVGAEGYLQYVKQTDEGQAYELQARYFTIINYCYQRGVSLIITSNLPLASKKEGAKTLADHIGGRAWSRLLEMAPTGYLLDLTGVPDYRKKVSGR